MKSLIAGFVLFLSTSVSAQSFDPNAPFLKQWDEQMKIADKHVAAPDFTLKTESIVKIHGENLQLKKFEPLKIKMPNGADYCEVIPLGDDVKFSKAPLEDYFLAKDAHYGLAKKAKSDFSITPYQTIHFSMIDDRKNPIDLKCKFLRKEDLVVVEMDKKSCEAQGGTSGVTYRPGVALRSIAGLDTELLDHAKFESCVVKGKPTTFKDLQAKFKEQGMEIKYREFRITSQSAPFVDGKRVQPGIK